MVAAVGAKSLFAAQESHKYLWGNDVAMSVPKAGCHAACSPMHARARVPKRVACMLPQDALTEQAYRELQHTHYRHTDNDARAMDRLKEYYVLKMRVFMEGGGVGGSCNGIAHVWESSFAYNGAPNHDQWLSALMFMSSAHPHAPTELFELDEVDE